MIKHITVGEGDTFTEAFEVFVNKVNEIIDRLNEMEKPVVIYGEPLRNSNKPQNKCCSSCFMGSPCANEDCPCHHKPQEEMVEKKVYVVISDLGEETMLGCYSKAKLLAALNSIK